ncbi:MAG: hypothetical protein EON55_21735 [Alphaproteobacteria bacterium]|nr:MAG: hypothetical protein EON55_21735 [Alphaproteobacteria bacterium]
MNDVRIAPFPDIIRLLDRRFMAVGANSKCRRRDDFISAKQESLKILAVRGRAGVEGLVREAGVGRVPLHPGIACGCDIATSLEPERVRKAFPAELKVKAGCIRARSG